MCLALPGKIVEIRGENAIVEYGSEKREARLMNEDIKIGEYVIVQNQLILQSMPEKEALEAIELWKEALENEG
jgi:hydrogenase expression/formation protein HypC